MSRRVSAAILLGIALATPASGTPSANVLMRGHGHGGGGPSPSGASDEEFVGPFASWMCARSSASGTCGAAAAVFCNAVADGVTDDAAVLNSCITTNLGSTHPVLYFPSGTYRINSSLSPPPSQFVTLVGQNPVNTTIKWGGASGGTLILLSGANGLNNSAVNRLTFDGGGTAKILVDQSVTSGFDTGNQYADDVFTNASGTLSYGFRCGAHGNGCAETEIIRAKFNGLNGAVVLCNANALDMWVWYSTFTANQYAITNDDIVFNPSTGSCTGGNYHAIDSIFNNSTAGDLYSSHGGLFDAIGNFSSGSNQFIPVHGDQLTMQHNTILNTTLGTSIGACTSVILIDNAILTKVGNVAPVVSGSTGSCGGGDLLSVGNTFTLSSAEQNYDKIYQVDDVVDTGGTTINQTPPILPGTPPQACASGCGITHTIYEATPSGSGTTCTAGSPCAAQTAICKASNGAGSTFVSGACTGTADGLKNVAHLAVGSYTVSATIVIPANSNAQIIGDAMATKLSGGVGVTPILRVNGPTTVVLRDFQVTPASGQDGIEINGVDQAGAVVYLQDAYGGGVGGTGSALWADSLNNALVEAHDFSFPYATGTLLQRTGAGRLNIFFGDTSAGASGLSASGSGNTELFGVWEDAGPTGGWGTISGSGSLTHVGSNLNLANVFGTGGYDAYNFGGFTGEAALLNLNNGCQNSPPSGGNYYGTLGTGGQLLLGFSILAQLTNEAATGLTAYFFNKGYAYPGCVLTNITDAPSGGPSAAFVRSTLAPMRATLPRQVQATPPGISNVEIFRVLVSPGANAFHIIP